MFSFVHSKLHINRTTLNMCLLTTHNVLEIHPPWGIWLELMLQDNVLTFELITGNLPFLYWMYIYIVPNVLVLEDS